MRYKVVKDRFIGVFEQEVTAHVFKDASHELMQFWFHIGPVIFFTIIDLNLRYCLWNEQIPERQSGL